MILKSNSVPRHIFIADHPIHTFRLYWCSFLMRMTMTIIRLWKYRDKRTSKTSAFDKIRFFKNLLSMLQMPCFKLILIYIRCIWKNIIVTVIRKRYEGDCFKVYQYLHQHFYCTQKWSKVKHEYGQSVVEWLVCLNLASFCDRRFMDVTKSSDVLIDHQIILPAILLLMSLLAYIYECACLVRFMHWIGDRKLRWKWVSYFWMYRGW